jgi:hypothetical protein
VQYKEWENVQALELIMLEPVFARLEKHRDAQIYKTRQVVNNMKDLIYSP